MKFKSEAEMSECFRNFFTPKAKQAEIYWVEELEGLFGVPDFVFLKMARQRVLYVVALELKLRNWKQGLRQAFKYRNFSNESYLVLDKTQVAMANQNIAEFKRANIGLATFHKNGEFDLVFSPRPSAPFSLDFSYRMLQKYCKHSMMEPFKKTNDLSDLVFHRSLRARIMFQALLPLT